MTREEGKGSISLPVNVARLPQRGMPLTIEADSNQRSALAQAHGLIEVRSLQADVIVTSWKKGGVQVNGRVNARVIQSCIVSLEPVENLIDEEVSALLLPEGSRLAVPKRSAEGEILLDAEGDDTPETFSGDTIDIGALVEEFFSLAIDPWPRKPGASLPAETDTSEEPRGSLGAQLNELRKKL